MIPPPETVRVTTAKVVCDGSGEVEPGLGHPRVYLKIDEKGFVECGYCDRRFVLIGGPADNGAGGVPLETGAGPGAPADQPDHR